MKIGILCVVLFCLTYNSDAQAVFDIDVDELYVEDDDLIFVTKGEERSYSCDYDFEQVRDFQYRVDLDCEDEFEKSDEMIRLDPDDFMHYSEPPLLLKWLEGLYFISEPFERGSNFSYRFALVMREHFFVQIEEIQYGTDGEWKRDHGGLKLLNLCFLRINSGFLFVALVSEGGSLEAFILPDKNGGLVLQTRVAFKGERNWNIDMQPTNIFQSQDYYRIKKVDGGFAIFDKIFQEQLIDHVYDSIVITSNIIMGYDPDEVHLYSVLLEPLPLRNIQAAYDEGLRVQILADDRLYWYTPEGVVHDTLPLAQYGVCGNYYYTKRQLVAEAASVEQISTSGGIGFIPEFSDSITLLHGYRVSDLIYLNGTHEHEYDEYSNLGAIYQLPYNYYVFKSPVSNGIMEITIWSDTIKALYYRKLANLSPKHQVDSVRHLMRHVAPDISTKILFEHPDAEFYPSDYRHPVKYRIGELYGYFPLHDKPQYTKLSDFTIAFAKFKKRDGSKGWIDIHGREYPNIE